MLSLQQQKQQQRVRRSQRTDDRKGALFLSLPSRALWSQREWQIDRRTEGLSMLGSLLCCVRRLLLFVVPGDG